MAPQSINDTLTISNSTKIPQLGFGVYKSPRDVCVRSCHSALDAGYRHFDTAQFYGNEAEVGEAISLSPIDRKDIYITTKILVPAGSADASYDKCIESINKLDPASAGYVDLFLVHSPNRGAAARKEMWQALERIYHEGRAKSIGVSNFGIGHINELKSFAKVWPPHVNQLEACPPSIPASSQPLHPWAQQKEIVAYCQDNNIVVQAYCPIVRNQKADDQTLAAIAKKHGVTPNQVLIRYSLQKGWVPLPKSDNPERIRANADLYGFNLDEGDLATLNGLDQGAAGAIVQAADNN